jgi:hypothetical protein
MAVLAAKEPIDMVMFENLDIGNVLSSKMFCCHTISG